MALPNLFCIFAAINVKHSNYMGKFIDPRCDWAFKYIFGREDTKECLITFLNGLFEGEFVIKDVKFEKTELLGMRKDDRGVIFDVYCTTTDGRRIIVEMQNKEQEFFVDRALFYSAQAIIGQGKKGQWNYRLMPVYTVCFMNFVSKDPMLKTFRTDLALCNLKTGKRTSEKLRIIYLQLPLFTKRREEECDTIFECWIYILKNMNLFEQMPFREKYPIFRKLAAIGDLRKLTPEEREMYAEDIKNMRDIYATTMFERKVARQEGLAEGLAEGRAEGRAEGKKEQQNAIARLMITEGMSLELVSKCTGLTIDQIKKLKSN